MITFLDVETTFVIKENKRSDPSPFHQDNKLVSVQYSQGSQKPEFVWFSHVTMSGTSLTNGNFTKIQKILDDATLLVGHNIKFDLMWLLESGFKYSKPVYDTMIAEYVLMRGQKWGLSLADCCIRRDVTKKKGELVDDYLKKGIGFDAMPKETVEEYGITDILSTRDLFIEQQKVFKRPKNYEMYKHVKLMNKLLLVLSDIERNGIKINFDKLEQVRKDYENEKIQLEQTMQDICADVMGDTPINFASPEQMCQLIYSRKVLDKKTWAREFNIGLNEKGKPLPRPRLANGKFVHNIRTLTERMQKTKAEHCNKCKGKGSYYKFKKDGTAWKKPVKYKNCMAR